VGNYPEDKQLSMLRFAQLLVSFYQPQAVVKLIQPFVVFGGLPGLPLSVRKYVSYIDKLLLFPLWLSLFSRSYQIIHIADHGNAFYAFCCSSARCIVTCHDLLALRAALGDSSVACRTSPIGIWLQRLIRAGLKRSDAVAFVSHATFSDFQCLIGLPSGQEHRVICNSLNANFVRDIASIKLSLDETYLIPPSPFLLMVGSSDSRKNRLLALRLLVELGPTSPYTVAFAGAPLSNDDQVFIAKHKLGDRVHSIVFPSHSLLNHLYGKAHALLFPSISEGFGWPLIEAQACGCPVIASTMTSVPEVAGDAALYADPQDVVSFSNHVLTLEDQAVRTMLIGMGEENVHRFNPHVIGRAYLSFAFQPRMR
jgi:glycosyltransferase involved in cell wall biosynthesis